MKRAFIFFLALWIFNLSIDTDCLVSNSLSTSQGEIDDKDDMVELISEFITGNNDLFNEDNDGGNDDEQDQSQAPVKECVYSFAAYQSLIPSPLVLLQNEEQGAFLSNYVEILHKDVYIEIQTPPPNTLS